MSAAFVATVGGSGAMVGERHPLPSEPSELGALEGCSAIDVTGNASLSDAVVAPCSSSRR